MDIAGRRYGPLLPMRYDDDNDDKEKWEESSPQSKKLGPIPHILLADSDATKIQAVEFDFKTYIFRFLKPKNPQKPNLGFQGFFILWCNLVNKRYIRILIAICEIHQCHLHFSVFTWCLLSFAHWRFVFSKICMECFSCAFGSYFHVRS